ncbi:MAG TPA: NUDIX hydrolase [Ktedonobacteraceae bacterium]|nr:NUDIX hydrolase [Ktedonobacteraceae bacterium]
MLLKENLYRLLGKTAGGFFNGLNVLLNGNLPPFGSVCVVIKEGERYLLLKQSHGKIVLPGGFMRWREDPLDAAIRESKEETGLNVHILDMIGCFSCPSDDPWRMSTLTLVYSAEIASGRPRQAAEGRPLWCSEAEVIQMLELRSRRFFESYLRYYRQPGGTDQQAVALVRAPISERL